MYSRKSTAPATLAVSCDSLSAVRAACRAADAAVTS